MLITTVYRLKYETENNELLKFFMLRNERKEPSMTYLKRSLYIPTYYTTTTTGDIDHRNLIFERGIMFMLML